MLLGLRQDILPLLLLKLLFPLSQLSIYSEGNSLTSGDQPYLCCGGDIPPQTNDVFFLVMTNKVKLFKVEVMSGIRLVR